MGTGDYEAGYATAAEAAEIARRFADADLSGSPGRPGPCADQPGPRRGGLRLVDEMLVVATEGGSPRSSPASSTATRSPSAVDGYALRPAREWTDALTGGASGSRRWWRTTASAWCIGRRCIHLTGPGPIALDEARRRGDGSPRACSTRSLAARRLLRGEIHRCGATSRGRGAYREANRLGTNRSRASRCCGWRRRSRRRGRRDPPRHRRDDRAATARAPAARVRRGHARGRRPSSGRTPRARARRDRPAPGNEVAPRWPRSAEGRSLWRGRGAGGADRAAPGDASWSDWPAPYEAARARELHRPGLPGSRRQGDGRARAGGRARAFAQLGATLDQARVDALPGAPPRKPRADRARARGAPAGGRRPSNREIAAALVISEHTVARHLQNIFAKLGVARGPRRPPTPSSTASSDPWSD